MTNSIDEDHKHFIDVIGGKLRKELQKYVKTNRFVRLRANGGEGYHSCTNY